MTNQPLPGMPEPPPEADLLWNEVRARTYETRSFEVVIRNTTYDENFPRLSDLRRLIVAADKIGGMGDPHLQIHKPADRDPDQWSIGIEVTATTTTELPGASS